MIPMLTTYLTISGVILSFSLRLLVCPFICGGLVPFLAIRLRKCRLLGWSPWDIGHLYAQGRVQLEFERVLWSIVNLLPLPVGCSSSFMSFVQFLLQAVVALLCCGSFSFFYFFLIRVWLGFFGSLVLLITYFIHSELLLGSGYSMLWRLA